MPKTKPVDGFEYFNEIATIRVEIEYTDPLIWRETCSIGFRNGCNIMYRNPPKRIREVRSRYCSISQSPQRVVNRGVQPVNVLTL